MKSWLDGVTAGVFLVALAILTLAVAMAAFDRPRALPHRPITELTNWGQGRAPEANHCPPGTLRFESEDGLFIECFRGTN